MSPRLTLLPAVLGLIAGFGLGVFITATEPPPPEPVMAAQFEKCLAGWRATIADWNASTDRLNAITRRSVP